MQLDASLSWLAMTLTPGLASRLSARLLKRFESPEGIFRATLTQLESCNLPAEVAQSIVKKEAFKRAEKELAAIRGIPNCTLLNWSDPEYPQNLLQIYDPPVLLYVRGDVQMLNRPSISIVGTRRPTLYGRKWRSASVAILRCAGWSLSAGWHAASTPSAIKARWPRTARPSGYLAPGSMFAIPRKTKSSSRKCWSAARL